MRRGRHPDKGQPGKPNVRARWFAKENKTHARPELYASTPPLEALNVVLSEVTTGKRGGKLWQWSTCEGRISTLHRKGECSLNCRQRISRQVMNTCAAVAIQLVRHVLRSPKNWEEELASTPSDLKLMRGIACPSVWQGCIKGEHVVATHGDDITIGGDRSAVGTPHQDGVKKIRDQETVDR